MEASSQDHAALNDHLRRLVEGYRRGFGQVVDPVQYGVLRTVADGRRARPSEIAAALDVIPSSVTRHVQALAEDGLVAVEPNPDDGRSSFVALTDLGERELRRFEEAGVAASAAVLADWSGEDLRALTALLGRLVEAWEARGPSKRRPRRLGRQA